MRKIILSILTKIAVTLLCITSISVSAYDGSSTIYANTQFPNTYNLSVGESYQKGYSDLTYKMVTLARQVGMFTSQEGSVLYVNILSVTGLPTGLSWDQIKDSRHPADNTFYIYGTVPVNITPGTYEVSVVGEDAAAGNTATQIIKLHIGTALPQPTQPTLSISGVLGATANPVSISQYFHAPNGLPMEYKTVANAGPLPAGISLDTNGNFIGHYTQVGTFPNVQVVAREVGQTDYGFPLTMTFSVSTAPISQATTLTCPTVTQLQGCPSSVTVMDSAGHPHTFVSKICNGVLWDFNRADLRLAGSSVPNGLSCSYLTSTVPQGIGFVYTLDPAPVGTYYGSNPSDTTGSCTTSVSACTFNIP